MQVCPRAQTLGLCFSSTHYDLVKNVSSDARLFTDDTSLFTVVYDKEVAATWLNCDPEIISQWVYQWKMQFSPDKHKQAIQVIFLKRGIDQRIHYHILMDLKSF